jgi:hypothetical protein
MDIVFILIAAGFFALTAAFLPFTDRIKGN